MMTKRHFEAAAALVANIKAGHWTNEFPRWAGSQAQGRDIEVSAEDSGNLDVNYTRAVWTAEAFEIFFAADNPRFDRQRFLNACGFPVKA